MNLTYLITAGPTQESIDPIRYLTNHSSGKMGYALAKAAAKNNSFVILVTGPTQLKIPNNVECHKSITAKDMNTIVMREYIRADIFIGVAAVSDYTPKITYRNKLKKSHNSIILTLEPAVDIIKNVSSLKEPPFLVGFCAETHNIENFAKEKLRKKKLDLIVANDVSRSDIGFNVDYNSIVVYFNKGKKKFHKASKNKIAEKLIQFIEKHYDKKYNHRI